MKVIAIQSSSNTDGLTSTLAQAVLKGAESEGGKTELVHLNKLNIKQCIACETGWGRCRQEGICILVDDFENLRQKIAESDALIFATPVYFGDLSESARTFLDRAKTNRSFQQEELLQRKEGHRNSLSRRKRPRRRKSPLKPRNLPQKTGIRHLGPSPRHKIHKGQHTPNAGNSGQTPCKDVRRGVT